MLENKDLKSFKPHRLNKKEFKEYLDLGVLATREEKELMVKHLKKPYLKADGTVTATGKLAESASNWVGSKYDEDNDDAEQDAKDYKSDGDY